MLDKEEVKLMNELTSTEYVLYKFIKMWQDDRRETTPDDGYVYEKIGIPRTTYFRAVKSLKIKGVL